MLFVVYCFIFQKNKTKLVWETERREPEGRVERNGRSRKKHWDIIHYKHLHLTMFYLLLEKQAGELNRDQKTNKAGGRGGGKRIHKHTPSAKL